MIGRENRYWIWAAGVVSALLFFIFKFFYPNPNMVMDSYLYVRGAVLGLSVNSFPIGYSWFLRMFCFFSHSARVFVGFQYLLLMGACCWLFLTVLKCFRLSKWVAWLLFAFLFCNPLFLYTSNFIMSDTLFTALSVGWFTQLLWIVFRPRRYMIWTHALLILLAFAVRYNALFYPLVASVVLLLCRWSIRWKLAAIGLQFLFIGAFVGFTKAEMRQVSGTNQFSPFGGWQLANNALYAYGRAPFGEALPPQFRELDNRVRHYFDSSHRYESLLDYDAEGPGFYYMVSPNSPLVGYMVNRYGADTAVHDLRTWGAMGALYSAYGAYLIRKHPIAYARYWVWPNTIRFFSPPTEIYSMFSPYYFRDDDFGRMTRELFHIGTLAASRVAINFRTALLGWYPLVFLLLNLFFVLAVIAFCGMGFIPRTGRAERQSIFFAVLLWLANLGFSVTASCVVLRYQLFSMIVMACFSLLLAEKITAKEAESSPQNG
jgi:hypothetical protein